MGEIKAEIRSKDATIDELQTENKRLKKEVERLERVRDNRSNNGVNPVDNRRTNSNRGGNVGVRENGRIINVEATAYTAFCPTGCIGITKTGLDVSSTIYTPEGLRVIAVDPAVIPLGSHVRVTLANGDSFEAKAEDTGGDIKGARIDVLVSDRANAYKLGRQSATVEVLSK